MCKIWLRSVYSFPGYRQKSKGVTDGQTDGRTDRQSDLQSRLHATKTQTTWKFNSKWPKSEEKCKGGGYATPSGKSCVRHCQWHMKSLNVHCPRRRHIRGIETIYLFGYLGVYRLKSLALGLFVNCIIFAFSWLLFKKLKIGN